jgi:hypothetical protein
MKIVRSFLMILSFIALFVITLPGAVTAGGDSRLAVAGFDSDTMKDGAPAGWELVENKGVPNLVLESANDKFALHMKSDSESSFGIKKEMEVAIEDYPFLSWEWKVAKLPAGADVRNADTDDQAIQIYIAFKPTGWPAKMKTPTIGYIWDVECPKDTMVTSPQTLADKVRYIVLRNKSDTLNEWYQEKRNLKEDYKKLFPDIDDGKPRDIVGVSFYINSQHTKSEAESWIYNVCFGRE